MEVDEDGNGLGSITIEIESSADKAVQATILISTAKNKIASTQCCVIL